MEITVAEYLIKKLHTIGIENIFGLPGDYNFNILDAILNSKDVEWTNCTNELNAGYAADGYARVKGFGAIVTTYGVGELSAINAIAGSYAENVPVMQIAGVPSSLFIKNNVLVHHNYANPDYYVFERIYKEVTAATAYLTKENAKEEIDRVIDIMVNKKLPVYVALPVDVACEYIDDTGFDVINYQKSNEENLKAAFNMVYTLLKNAKSPILLIDYLIKRFNLNNEMQAFINNTHIPFSSLLMGKGAVSECSPDFLGMNMGSLSSDIVKNEIKKSDLIITAGFLNADLNTGGFTVLNDKEIDIKIEKTSITIKGKTFNDVLIQDFLPLLAQIKDIKYTHNEFIKPKETERNNGKLKVDDIFPKIEKIFSNGDIFLMETGLMSLSGAYLKLKCDMKYLSQTLYGSIGWATPAAFGAAMANRALSGIGTPILFTGEGAHQLTIQETANFFELNLKPVIFILNNGGYTIERVLSKDFNDKFNDIINWDYMKIIEGFNGFNGGADYYKAQVHSVEEFDKILPEIILNKGKKLCYIELFTSSDDITKPAPILVENMKKFAAGLNSH